jgi:hypothetical protein
MADFGLNDELIEDFGLDDEQVGQSAVTQPAIKPGMQAMKPTMMAELAGRNSMGMASILPKLKPPVWMLTLVRTWVPLLEPPLPGMRKRLRLM